MFCNIRGIYKLNYNLAHLTWLKVGGPADIFFKPADIDDLIYFLKENNGALPVQVIGAGSNLIIRDKGIEGVVVKLTRNFADITINKEGNLSAGAGCLNYNLAQFCKINAIKGYEFLIGIPGTVGGGVAMNAGAYGREFKDIIIAIEALDFYGNKLTIPASEIIFSYRKNSLPANLIYTNVIFRTEAGNIADIENKMREINLNRYNTQPIRQKTGGSSFTNPDGLKAWQLIDQAGLRGQKLGGACVSELHCNFLINDNNATAGEIEELGEMIRAKVREHSGINLEWEIKRIGRK